MFSYERVAWLGFGDIGFPYKNLGKRAYNFCVLPPFPLFLEFCARTRPPDLLLFSSRKPGSNFSQGEIRSGNRASPVNRPAPVKI